MLFSIVVPVYKVENYLERCVDSILSQTFTDLELILVDDGSPDHSGEICDKYAAADARVRVIHKENGGLSSARNHGAKSAVGDYVLFIDSDDYVIEGALGELSAFCSGEDVVMFDGVTEGGVCDLSHIGEKGLFDSRDFLKASLAADKMPNAAVLNAYRREFLVEKGLSFKLGILHEDEHFTPRAMLAASRVCNSGVLLYKYLIREDSISTERDMRRNARDLYSTLCELSSIYSDVSDKNLRRLLFDSLAVKYLNMF